MKRHLLLIILILGLAGPTLAQGGDERPPREVDREQLRERMRQRAEERRGQGNAPEGRGERSERGGEGRPDRHERPGIRAEDIEVALEVMAEFRPEVAEQLRELAQDDPQAAAERIARAFPRIGEFVEMKLSEPRRFELHLQSMRTMKQLWPLRHHYMRAESEGDQAKMAELRPQIREHVATLFDIRLELRRMEIEKLRRQLQRLEQGVQELEDPEVREREIERALENDLRERDRERLRGPQDGRPHREPGQPEI